MKKTLIIVALLGMMIPAMAQTSPLQKSPQTLAQEMTASISQIVTISPEQSTQLTTAAEQYFTTLRSMAQTSTPEERTKLYENFQITLATILTPENYDLWRASIEAHTQQPQN